MTDLTTIQVRIKSDMNIETLRATALDLLGRLNAALEALAKDAEELKACEIPSKP